MNVFGTFNQFSEGGDGFSGGSCGRSMDFEKDGAVALDDKGVFRIVGHL